MFWTWIAAFAFLFSAWGPALSHAIAFNNATAGEEVQICTMVGMKTLVVTQGGSGKTDPHTPIHPLEHCPCCAAHGGPGLPLPSRFALVLPEASSPIPRLFYRSPTPLFAWTSASPRGPPVRESATV
jgi:hypothetical protein